MGYRLRPVLPPVTYAYVTVTYATVGFQREVGSIRLGALMYWCEGAKRKPWHTGTPLQFSDTEQPSQPFRVLSRLRVRLRPRRFPVLLAAGGAGFGRCRA